MTPAIRDRESGIRDRGSGNQKERLNSSVIAFFAAGMSMRVPVPVKWTCSITGSLPSFNSAHAEAFDVFGQEERVYRRR